MPSSALFTADSLPLQNCLDLHITNLFLYWIKLGACIINILWSLMMTIVSWLMNKVMSQLGASLTYDPRVIIYDHNMFIIEAIGVQNNRIKYWNFFSKIFKIEVFTTLYKQRKLNGMLKWQAVNVLRLQKLNHN